MGDQWVHLRLCMTCGHVGCCDDSKNKHATKHFHAIHHPIMKSIEPGEDWGWSLLRGRNRARFRRINGDAATKIFHPAINEIPRPVGRTAVRQSSHRQLSWCARQLGENPVRLREYLLHRRPARHYRLSKSGRTARENPRARRAFSRVFWRAVRPDSGKPLSREGQLMRRCSHSRTGF